MKRSLLILSALFVCACSAPATSSEPTSKEGTTSEIETVTSNTEAVTSEKESSSCGEISILTTQEESNTTVESSSNKQEYARDPMDEPYIGEQYYLNHIGDIYSAWNEYRGDGVTIAVIDVGFNPYHEDFYYENGESKVDPKSASFVTTNGKTATEVGVEKVVNMGESHGTFCAGVAAAAINGKGVAGIAPNASLLLLKTDAKPKSIAAAFHYAADNGARVVSISIGSYYSYEGDLAEDDSDLATVFEEPVAYCIDKGAVVISAAGNGGKTNPTEYTFPAAATNVIGVGGLAANSSGELWEGSSYNSQPQYQFCDVFAPADGMFGCCHYDNKLYDGNWKGTSFAAPQVAGMAALYFQKNPNKTPIDFEYSLYDSCHKITNSSIAKDYQTGYGAVDVGRLLKVDSKEQIEVKFQSNWSSVYCYAWNEETQKEIAPWPGKLLTKTNGVYSLTIDASLYHSLLFAKNASGAKTVDLRVSSFSSGKTYTVTNEKSLNVGSYR